MRSGHLTAIFAGGCFWCTEAALQKLPGVVSVESGYTGGTVANPTYEQVCSGTTGHYEAVRVRYDPRRIAYRDLLDAFWRSIDPTDGGGQFVDRGTQYRSAIFVSDDEQRRWAEAGKAALDASGVLPGKVATAILPTERFYPAEPYHQDYFQTNASAYERYRLGSGRDACLARVWTAKPEPVPVWKKPEAGTLQKQLTDLQWRVTQEGATEPPHRNAYDQERRPGIYVDITTGEPLFSSLDKFDAGCGWPSFAKPLEPAAVIERADGSHGMRRTEVRSRSGDAHLGHLFDDGPGPTSLRYCINSASLRFIPAEDLESKGYGRYRALFPAAQP